MARVIWQGHPAKSTLQGWGEEVGDPGGGLPQSGQSGHGGPDQGARTEGAPHRGHPPGHTDGGVPEGTPGADEAPAQRPRPFRPLPSPQSLIHHKRSSL